MTINPKIHQFLEQLLEQSKANKVDWNLTHKQDVLLEEKCYQANFFNKTKVELIRSSSNSFLDYVKATLTHEDRPAYEIVIEDESQTEFALLTTLYQEAERYVTGWDQAIEEIERTFAADHEVSFTVKQVAS